MTLALRPDDETPITGAAFGQREQCDSVRKDKAGRVGDTERAVWPEGRVTGRGRRRGQRQTEARTRRILRANFKCRFFLLQWEATGDGLRQGNTRETSLLSPLTAGVPRCLPWSLSDSSRGVGGRACRKPPGIPALVTHRERALPP